MAATIGCEAGCRCSCNQIACGCHLPAAETAPRAETVTIINGTSVVTGGNTGPTALCKACGGRAPMRSYRSPKGTVVTVVLCPGCDNGGGSR